MRRVSAFAVRLYRLAAPLLARPAPSGVSRLPPRWKRTTTCWTSRRFCHRTTRRQGPPGAQHALLASLCALLILRCFRVSRSKRGRGGGKYSLDALVEDAAEDEVEAAKRSKRAAKASAALAAARAAAAGDGDSDDEALGAAAHETAVVRCFARRFPPLACARVCALYAPSRRADVARAPSRRLLRSTKAARCRWWAIWPKTQRRR